MIKLKVKLRELLVDALGETAQIPATVEVSELLDFTDNDYGELDLDELLSENRLIAHIWGIEDVRSIRADLNADQAWAVLQQVEKDLDSSRGITWDDLEQTAHDLFGSSTAIRVERCDQVVQGNSDDLPESNLIDFLTDAIHWCQAKGQDFEESLELARRHFDTESSSN